MSSDAQWYRYLEHGGDSGLWCCEVHEIVLTEEDECHLCEEDEE